MKKIKLYFLLLPVLLFSFSISQSQEKLYVRAGMGVPELIHVGLKYRFGEFSAGMYIGVLKIDRNSYRAITGDISWHFAGKSEFTDRKPWFVKTGFTYMRSEDPDDIAKDNVVNLRIGKDMNLSQRFCLSFECGPSHMLSSKKSTKKKQMI